MEIEKIIGALGYALNKSHEEVSKTLLNEEGQLIENLEQIVKEIHDQNVHEQTSVRKEMFDNGYKKAQREVLERKENELRQRFEVDGATIDEIVEEIHNSGKREAKVNPSDVRNSEIYINDIKKLKTREEELEGEIQRLQKERELEKIRSVAFERIPSVLREAKKVIPEDANMKEYIDLILLQMERKGINIVINDDGDPIPVDGEGNRLRNERTLKDLTFSEVIVSNAFFIPTAENSGGQSPGNSNPPSGSGKVYDYSHVKDGQSYLQEMDRVIEEFGSPEHEAERNERVKALEEHGAALGL